MGGNEVELQGLFCVAQFLLNDSHSVPCLENSRVLDNDLLKELYSFLVLLVDVCAIGQTEKPLHFGVINNSSLFRPL